MCENAFGASNEVSVWFMESKEFVQRVTVVGQSMLEQRNL